ncbi:Armadillo-like helical domain-containing protein 2 [Varanus komodoensis]|uniref:armadillo-like helical domain-containing protein 2 n=1 Tax=Varanus komodoensis TaxID=61221 RepID=UPI001CF7C48D|nr:armadillo-like helical domain-containing protein 2 [Varanus komodoensis]KAF7245235.1 Armadillo-like helical domain-containing protein 2 [Varanus komodoensis]
MGSTISKVQGWYEKNIQDTREPAIKLIDPIFHHHKIKTYAIDLRNAELPLEKRALAALYIGLLAYTGGISAAELVSQYIKDMIDILIMPDTSGKVRIAVLKGLCGVCYLSYTNQNEAKENHLTEILISYLDEDEDSPEADSDLITVKFWVCYLMTVVCCNNTPCIKLFHEVGGQMLEKKLDSLSNMDWFGWPQNYAKLMFMLMGYSNVQADK